MKWRQKRSLWACEPWIISINPGTPRVNPSSHATKRRAYRSQRGTRNRLSPCATFVFHFARAGAYGYQRDELYFITCARHLAFGYVDQPPLIALVTRFVLSTLRRFALRAALVFRHLPPQQPPFF